MCTLLKLSRLAAASYATLLQVQRNTTQLYVALSSHLAWSVQQNVGRKSWEKKLGEKVDVAGVAGEVGGDPGFKPVISAPRWQGRTTNHVAPDALLTPGLLALVPPAHPHHTGHQQALWQLHAEGQWGWLLVWMPCGWVSSHGWYGVGHSADEA